MKLASVAPDVEFRADDLERLFAACFAAQYNTQLIGGAAEPLYLPSPDGREPHRLFYREDFFASALHEIAHWCIAGHERRQQRDFDYWYYPEGRTAAQQAAFLQAESAPQALEWLFAKACDYPFQISFDDFSCAPEVQSQKAQFAHDIHHHVKTWQRRGLPQRAECFYRALAAHFGVGIASSDVELDLNELL